MSGFLIEYNRKSTGWRLTEFDGPDGPAQAITRRLELERERPSEDWEIAALVSDSEASIRVTHSRYFQGAELTPA